MNNDNGWIKIHRGITDHWLWHDAEKLKWWFDLLFMANWEDKKVMHDSHLFTLQRGQMIASISYLAERWGKSNKTIIKFLKLLEDEGMICRQVVHRQTPIITICNYGKYQVAESQQVHTQVHSIVHTQVHGIVHTNKEYKEYKEDNNSSLNRELCLNSKELKPLGNTRESNFEKIETTEYAETEAITPEQTDRTPYKKVQQLWNNICADYPKLRHLSESRKTKLKLRLAEMAETDNPLNVITQVFQSMQQSPFLKGDNPRGWKATFDWIIANDKNWIKVIEGNYNNTQRNVNTYYQQNSTGCAQTAEQRRAEIEQLMLRKRNQPQSGSAIWDVE